MQNLIAKCAIAASRKRAIPYKYRMSVIKRLHPSMLKDFPFEADLMGLRFSGNLVNFIDRMIYFTGAHEKHMLHFLRDVIGGLRAANLSPIVFADVGANAGNHSLYLSTLADQVYAFEPFERVRKQFEANIARNRISNIRVFPFGLSNRQETLPFYAGPDSNLGAASFVKDHTTYNTLLGEIVVKVGDEVAEQEHLLPVTLLKADVEGFEKNVLEGLAQTLQHDRPLIIAEMSPTTLESFDHSAANIRAAFPPDYDFYYFSYGNYNSGAYRLAPYDFTFHYKHQDVIACPREWQNAWIPDRP